MPQALWTLSSVGQSARDGQFSRGCRRFESCRVRLHQVFQVPIANYRGYTEGVVADISLNSPEHRSLTLWKKRDTGGSVCPYIVGCQ